MAKIKSLDDLKKISKTYKNQVNLRNKGDNIENLLQIKVSMATCGIASGAKETMELFMEELDKQNIEAVITQTGCMGYCHSEPTVEVTLPQKDPIVFGNVKRERVLEIIEKYIKQGELVDDIIPVNYEKVEYN